MYSYTSIKIFKKERLRAIFECTNYQKLATLNFIICKIHVNNMKIGNHFKQSHSMSNSYLHEKFILIFKFILKFKRKSVLKFYLYFYYITR